MEYLLSRQPDSSEWGVDKSLYKEICRELGVQVALDLFASDTWHVSARFVCSTFTPSCVAVQALAIDSRLLLNEGEFA
jgi:hypothetical protein